MDMRKAFPGNFLKAGDLAGESRVITITGITHEEVGDDKKYVVRFEGSDQGLVLNQTNNNALMAILGTDSKGWVGKRVELYSTKVQFGSKQVDAIRVRPVAYTPPPDVPFDDDVPLNL